MMILTAANITGDIKTALWFHPVSHTCAHTHTHTVTHRFEKVSPTPSEKWSLTLRCDSDWLCKQLKCEISQRLSRKPFDTLKKIRSDYTNLEGGLSKTVNFAFQTIRVGDFLFQQAWGKPLRERSSASLQTHLRPWLFFSQLFPVSYSHEAATLCCCPFASVLFSTSTMTVEEFPANAEACTNLPSASQAPQSHLAV